MTPSTEVIFRNTQARLPGDAMLVGKDEDAGFYVSASEGRVYVSRRGLVWSLPRGTSLRLS